MEVRVLLPKWGRYSKGDTLELPKSTAMACIKAGAVEEVGKEKKAAKEVNSNK